MSSSDLPKILRTSAKIAKFWFSKSFLSDKNLQKNSDFFFFEEYWTRRLVKKCWFPPDGKYVVSFQSCIINLEWYLNVYALYLKASLGRPWWQTSTLSSLDRAGPWHFHAAQSGWGYKCLLLHPPVCADPESLGESKMQCNWSSKDSHWKSEKTCKRELLTIPCLSWILTKKI